MRLKRSCVLWTGLAMLAPMAAQAESLHPKLDARFYVDIAAYQPATETKLRIDGAGGAGTEISLEDDLDFEDRPTLPSVLMNFRLGERWRVEAEYFTVDRDSARTINKPINIGDNNFVINTTLSSSFDTDIYRLGVGYSFLKNQNSELGGVLGLHVTNFDLAASSGSGALAESRDALATLPTLGVYGYYAFSPKWLLTGRADVFSLDYEEYSGTLWNVNVGIEYHFTKNFGVGLAYRYVDYNVSVEKQVGPNSTDFSGEITYRLGGPSLYMSLMF